MRMREEQRSLEEKRENEEEKERKIWKLKEFETFNKVVKKRKITIKVPSIEDNEGLSMGKRGGRKMEPTDLRLMRQRYVCMRYP
jgi:hypothetical protein